MDNVDISFIIPAFNCGQYIEETIFSIVNLGLDNFEIIVVDDGSEDDTINILERMHLSSLKILKSDSKGVSAARNTGIKNACGRYISFMDADDECIKKSFKTAYNILCNNNSLDGIYIGIPEFCDSAMVSFKKQPKLNFNAENKIYSVFSSQLFTTVQSLILKKEVFDKIGFFDESLDIAEDFDLYIRIFEKCNIHIINTNYGFKYRQNPNSLMNSLKNEEKLIKGMEFVVSTIRNYDFKDKKLNKKREYLASLKFLDLIYSVAKNGNKSRARSLLSEFFFSAPKINFKILKRVAKIIAII